MEEGVLSLEVAPREGWLLDPHRVTEAQTKAGEVTPTSQRWKLRTGVSAQEAGL